MAYVDLPREELERYRPALPVPGDLEPFWAGTLAQARAVDAPGRSTRYGRARPWTRPGSRLPDAAGAAGSRSRSRHCATISWRSCRTCPPSTVYAAYHAYGGAPKEIAVCEYNDHEGGGEAFQPGAPARLAGYQ